MLAVLTAPLASTVAIHILAAAPSAIDAPLVALAPLVRRRTRSQTEDTQAAKRQRSQASKCLPARRSRSERFGHSLKRCQFHDCLLHVLSMSARSPRPECPENPGDRFAWTQPSWLFGPMLGGGPGPACPGPRGKVDRIVDDDAMRNGATSRLATHHRGELALGWQREVPNRGNIGGQVLCPSNSYQPSPASSHA